MKRGSIRSLWTRRSPIYQLRSPMVLPTLCSIKPGRRDSKSGHKCYAERWRNRLELHSLRCTAWYKCWRCIVWPAPDKANSKEKQKHHARWSKLSLWVVVSWMLSSDLESLEPIGIFHRHIKRMNFLEVDSDALLIGLGIANGPTQNSVQR